jgi:hypothetical protein
VNVMLRLSNKDITIVGDLAFNIKRRRAKGEFLSETEIMNWFV